MSTFTLDPPLIADADVVIVGSGSAGATAAIAAARGGATVVLIEKLPYLGGISTSVLDTIYGFFTPGSQSTKVVGGVADDVIGAMRDLGPVLERPNTYGAGTGVTYNMEHLKLAWERLVRGAGVRVLLHSFVQDVSVRDGHVEELLVATKAGLARVAGRAFIDASGDADLCFHAGFGYERAGEKAAAQSLTTTFRMIGVDMERRRSITTAQFHALMAGAAESGEYDLPRREGSDHITPIESMTATNMTRLEATRPADDGVVDTSDPDFLSAAGALLPGNVDQGAGTPAEIAALVTTCLEESRHDDGVLLGACYRAEAFLATWLDAPLFGRPLAA